jgi:methyltransferase (TIGR00027 family)
LPALRAEGNRVLDEIPSTAVAVAQLRAMHQLVDSPRVLLDDVVTSLFAGEPSFSRVEVSRPENVGIRSLRAYIVSRSRLAEDRLAVAVHRGVTQYIILGAGFDTFAYRNPWEHLRVFEVDLPALQTKKLSWLKRANIDVNRVRFVPVDFEETGLTDALRGAGFREDSKTFVCWVGVTYYLSESAFWRTLKALLQFAGCGEIVFDIFVAREHLGSNERTLVDRAAKVTANLGEPYRLHLDPDALSEALHQLGFRVRVWDGEALNQQYLQDRSDDLRIRSRLVRIFSATRLS